MRGPHNLNPLVQADFDAFVQVWRSWAQCSHSVLVIGLVINQGGIEWLQYARVRYVANRENLKGFSPRELKLGGIRLFSTLVQQPIDHEIEAGFFQGRVGYQGGEAALPTTKELPYNVAYLQDGLPRDLDRRLRRPALSISAERPLPADEKLLRGLEHSVQVLDTPYDGLEDLLSDFDVPFDVLRASQAQLEILIDPPAVTLANESSLSGSILTLKLSRTVRSQPEKLKIGIRVPAGSKTWNRSSHNLGPDEVADSQGHIRSTVHIETGRAATVQVLLSYDRHSICRDWVRSSEFQRNSRLLMTEHLDIGLKNLRRELLETDKGGHDFERVVVLLLQLLGFDCLYFGDVSAMQNGPDIYLEGPSGKTALIECSSVITSASEKMSKLHQRVDRFRSALKQRGFDKTPVGAVLFTRQSDTQIRPFLKEAARFGIAIRGIEDLRFFVDQLGDPPPLDVLFDRLVTVTDPPFWEN